MTARQALRRAEPRKRLVEVMRCGIVPSTLWRGLPTMPPTLTAGLRFACR